jgi:prepilin-type N-terminal cleavage/methylation domain-containing protein
MNPRRQHTGERHPDGECGFTMVELMIVVGVVGILLGIMIPTLLQARRPVQDRQAQNLLRNSLTAAKALETSDGASATRALLADEEPAVKFVDGATTAPAGQRSVSVATTTVAGIDYVILTSFATSGRCFAILEQANAAPRFQRLDGVPTCRADQFDTTTGWTTSWP